MNKKIKKLNIFISYSHKNIKYKEKLLTSLEALKQSYNIEPWHDGMIDAGGNIDDNVKNALDHSHIVLLIVTNDFLASYYCIKVELEKAIKREKQGDCIIVPVMFQDSVLTETLSFIKHNRVPEDGKPIATGFQNQNQGCTRAVNMIMKMIDKNYPNCKKSTSAKGVSSISTKTTRTSSIRNVQNLCMKLYKNGKLSNVPVSQNIIDMIPKYHSSIMYFKTMMDQSLLNAKKEYSKLYKTYQGSSIPFDKKLEKLRYYLMDICAYTKTYITENVGIKVHFRVSKNNFYVGLIASTDDDDKTDLHSDWTTKMTPIPMYQGLIYNSSQLNAPLIKSLNMKQNYKAQHDDIWKDYITFTFPKFHSGQTPLVSYCISIHKDYHKAKGDMLKILAYLNFGDIIEKYLFEYYTICKKIDRTYSLEDIINTL